MHFKQTDWARVIISDQTFGLIVQCVVHVLYTRVVNAIRIQFFLMQSYMIMPKFIYCKHKILGTRISFDKYIYNKYI